MAYIKREVIAKENKELRAQNATLQTTNKEKQAVIDKLRKQVTNLQADMRGKEEMHKRCVETSEVMGNEHAQLTGALAKAQETIETLESVIAYEEARTKSILAAFEGQVVSLSESLAEVLGLTSGSEEPNEE